MPVEILLNDPEALGTIDNNNVELLDTVEEDNVL
jgi:hypothetical protein